MSDIPERVFIDAASEYIYATGINIIPEALALTAGHRAAVASAYRAGQAATPDGPSHDYLSTACLHGQHEHCRSTVNINGDPKAPGTCKFCDAVCRCAECRHGATDQTEDNHG